MYCLNDNEEILCQSDSDCPPLQVDFETQRKTRYFCSELTCSFEDVPFCSTFENCKREREQQLIAYDAYLEREHAQDKQCTQSCLEYSKSCTCEQCLQACMANKDGDLCELCNTPVSDGASNVGYGGQSLSGASPIAALSYRYSEK